MKSIIILHKKGDYEVWGSITDICRAHKEIRYPTIKAKKFPFFYKGYDFIKIYYKTININ